MNVGQSAYWWSSLRHKESKGYLAADGIQIGKGLNSVDEGARNPVV